MVDLTVYKGRSTNNGRTYVITNQPGQGLQNSLPCEITLETIANQLMVQDHVLNHNKARRAYMDSVRAVLENDPETRLRCEQIVDVFLSDKSSARRINMAARFAIDAVADAVRKSSLYIDPKPETYDSTVSLFPGRR